MILAMRQGGDVVSTRQLRFAAFRAFGAVCPRTTSSALIPAGLVHRYLLSINTFRFWCIAHPIELFF